MGGDATNYPLFAGHRPGSLHLRGYDTSLEKSRLADVAAVAVAAHAASQCVLVVCSELRTNDVIASCRLGWRDRNLTVTYRTDLLGATAEFYALTARSSGPYTVIIDDLAALATGPEGGHDDRVAFCWIEALLSSDFDELHAITGLDADIYAPRSRGDVERPTLVCGSRFRRGGAAPSNLMGGERLICHADTVAAIVGADLVGNTVTASCSVLKHRLGPIGPVPLSRVVAGPGADYWVADQPSRRKSKDDERNFCGSNSCRQEVGKAGHCDRCCEVGHVAAHPQFGCADVGCDRAH